MKPTHSFNTIAEATLKVKKRESPPQVWPLIAPAFFILGVKAAPVAKTPETIKEEKKEPTKTPLDLEF